jgi:hypothetical protein
VDKQILNQMIMLIMKLLLRQILDYSVDTIVHFIQMFHDDSRARFRKQYSTNTAFQNDPGLHVW